MSGEVTSIEDEKRRAVKLTKSDSVDLIIRGNRASKEKKRGCPVYATRTPWRLIHPLLLQCFGG
jgi:hypothetical protein